MQRRDTDLVQRLQQLDGQGYPAYKSLKGAYAFEGFMLVLDRVQGDPFAAPSHVRLVVPQDQARFPAELYATAGRAVALADYLTRQFDRAIRGIESRRGSGKSGLMWVNAPGQAVLARTSVQVDAQQVEVRLGVGLPAFGRRIAGQQAIQLLTEDIPAAVAQSLRYGALDVEAIRLHIETVEDADWMRDRMVEQGLVAFVADGAILPRRSGVDDRPLADAIAFQSPESLRVSFTCPHAGVVTGMGIPSGITLIVGGGYHGKSTLLRALEQGIYNHIPQDGRERVVTHGATVKLRAEDGRSVVGVDISPFINHLPYGRSTQQFSTTNASGSTSQAASIVEAMEAGARVLLLDEDTSATNFMIRDRRMQALIAQANEPITPFIDKVRQLYQEYGISTILVMGGCGDYLDVADTVIAMESFVPREVTAEARAIAAQYPTHRQAEGGDRFGSLQPRHLRPESLNPQSGRREVSLKVRGVEGFRFGETEVDLTAVEQLVEPGQVRAIAAALVYAQRYLSDLNHHPSIPEILDMVCRDLAESGLDVLGEDTRGEWVMFRRHELAAALNRLRSLEVD